MMSNIRRFLIFAAVLLFLLSMLSFAADEVGAIKIGGGLGESNYAFGERVVEVHQGGCVYSIKLIKGQYLKFNNPDVVFLESKLMLDDKEWPYLSQSEMFSGFDWSFKFDSGLKLKWFGLMCESVKDFNFAGDAEVKSFLDDSGFNGVKEANGLKCPAILSEAGWVPTEEAGSNDSYLFENLVGEKWSGFIFGYKNEDSHTIGRIRFCLIKDGRVLVGGTESYPESLSISKQVFKEIQAVLLTVRFLQ